MSSISEQFYAIVVDVPNPQLKCFVAFPFSLDAPSEEFPVTDVIDKAIQRQGLTACWVSWAAPGTNIMENITHEILGASLVIAVCSPEKPGALTNPNVMYELGRAEALGKPILIMTTEAKALPFDVHGTQAFTYSADDLKDRRSRDALQARLENAINRLKASTVQAPPLVLKNLKDIWVVRAANRVVLTQEFWDYAKAIFAFADMLSKEGRALTGPLTRIFEMATRRCDVEPLLNDFLQTWNHHYCQAHVESMSQYAKQRDDGSRKDERSASRAMVEALLKRLLARGESFGAQELLSILQGDYDQLCSHIDDYLSSFATTKESVDSLMKTQEKPKDLLYQVSQLEQKLQNLTNFADNVVRSLIRTMNSWFYTQTSAVQNRRAAA